MKRFLIPLFTFVCVWLVVLLVPELCVIFLGELRGGMLQPVSALPAPETGNYDWNELAKQYPNDPRVVVLATEEFDALWPDTEDANPSLTEMWKRTDDTDKARIRYYDRLQQRFPDQAWIITRRLRATYEWLKHGRMGGELSDGNLLANVAAGKPSPEERPNEVNFTQMEWRRAVEMCRRGQRLEPDNAFFDWMLTCLLLANHRDTEAFEVLDRGSRKAHYNDHTGDDRKALIAAHELAVGRPLLYEEKLSVWFEVNFHSGSRLRETARLITWQGIKAQRRGDHQRALLIYGGLMRMADKMRRDSDNYNDALVLGMLGVMAGEGPARAQPWPVYAAQSKQQRSAIVRAYYSNRGRGDLLQLMDRWKAAWGAMRKQIAASSNGGALFGISVTTLAIISTVWKLGVVLLLVLLPTTLLWLLLSCLRNRGWPAATQLKVRTATVVYGLMACLGAVCILCLCSIGNSVHAVLQSFDFRAGGFVGGAGTEIVSAFAYDSATPLLAVRWVAALAPALTALVYCFVTASRWQRRTYVTVPSLWQQLKASLTSGALLATFPRDLRPLASLIIEAGLIFLLLAAWVAQAVVQSDDYYKLSPYIISLLSLACLAWVVWKWWRLPARRIALRFALDLCRATLGSFVTALSVLWLLLVIISLPLRRAVDNRIDSVFQHGEVRMLSDINNR